MTNEIRDIIPKLFMYCCRIFPVKKHKIVFKSFRGIGCSDNPRAIYDELYRQRPDYEYIWVTQDLSRAVTGAKMVRHGSLREIYHLATARLWIDNKRKGCWVVKRKGQIYIQTWHGGIALKKIEKDAESSLPKYYIKSCKHDSRIADYFISGSKWQNWQYKHAFWFRKDILRFGLPRADILYRDPMEYRRKVCSFYKIPKDTKILLYAPTFRDDGDVSVYNINYAELKNSLESRFGGEWKVIVRLHPNAMSRQDVITYNEYVLNGSIYEIMNELVVACDFFITDYSSGMFEAMEANKDICLYTPDLKKYEDARGFYFSLGDLPFPIATDNNELSELILNYNSLVFKKKINLFKEKVHLFNDGKATDRIVKFILQKID